MRMQTNQSGHSKPSDQHPDGNPDFEGGTPIPTSYAGSDPAYQAMTETWMFELSEMRKIIARNLINTMTDRSQHVDVSGYSAYQLEVAIFEREQNKGLAAIRAQPLLKPSFFEFGMGYNHNMPCPVYLDEPAVIMDDGHFHPSWRAQQEGWIMFKIKTAWQKWLWRKFFKGKV